MRSWCRARSAIADARPSKCSCSAATASPHSSIRPPTSHAAQCCAPAPSSIPACIFRSTSSSGDACNRQPRRDDRPSYEHRRVRDGRARRHDRGCGRDRRRRLCRRGQRRARRLRDRRGRGGRRRCSRRETGGSAHARDRRSRQHREDRSRRVVTGARHARTGAPRDARLMALSLLLAGPRFARKVGGLERALADVAAGLRELGFDVDDATGASLSPEALAVGCPPRRHVAVALQSIGSRRSRCGHGCRRDGGVRCAISLPRRPK